MAELKWEKVMTNHIQQEHFRAKVPGGWLVKWSKIYGVRESTRDPSGLTFVPDPKYEWK